MVYSAERDSKNSLEQDSWNDTLRISGENEALSNDLAVTLKVSGQRPEIQVTCEYVDGVLTVHYGNIAKTFQVTYSQISNEDDSDNADNYDDTYDDEE